MPNLVDTTFFVGDITIPNTHKAEVAENLNLFIGRRENELMLKLLGKELYDLYKANPTDPRFVAINDKLVYIIDGQKYSPIAYYVYWWWMKDKASWTSGVGNIRANSNVAVEVSPAIKMVHAWNTFSEGIRAFTTWMDDNSETYPEWSGRTYNWSYGNLYGYDEFRKTNDFDI